VRIALVHKRLDLKGGTERDFYQTAEGLRDLGHEIHLFCSEYGVQPPAGTIGHHVPVVPLGRTVRLWSFALLAPRVIRKQNCDVVVSFGRMIYQDVLRSGGGTHRGFLQRLGAERGAVRRFWQKISLYHRSLLKLEQLQFSQRRLKKIIAVSDEVKRDIVANYSVAPEKILVLYNGVDQKRFHPARSREIRESLRRQWNIPSDAPLVLFVGSGFLRKGLDRMIAIWNSPALSQVYLLVAGDDARMGRYKTWARSVAGDRIVFAGRQENIEDYYTMADIVALPALQEAFGNVVLEALASGVPVLVSRDVGAAPVLTGSLAQGVVEHPEDPQELEVKLRNLLEQAKTSGCAETARAIGEAYSWQNHFRRLDALLAEVSAPLARASVT
jgi:UDP-glucose:(heptosyl)LPS alpha-1,3-glucosyltransferase